MAMMTSPAGGSQLAELPGSIGLQTGPASAAASGDAIQNDRPPTFADLMQQSTLLPKASLAAPPSALPPSSVSTTAAANSKNVSAGPDSLPATAPSTTPDLLIAARTPQSQPNPELLSPFPSPEPENTVHLTTASVQPATIQPLTAPAMRPEQPALFEGPIPVPQPAGSLFVTAHNKIAKGTVQPSVNQPIAAAPKPAGKNALAAFDPSAGTLLSAAATPCTTTAPPEPLAPVSGAAVASAVVPAVLGAVNSKSLSGVPTTPAAPVTPTPAATTPLAAPLPESTTFAQPPAATDRAEATLAAEPPRTSPPPTPEGLLIAAQLLPVAFHPALAQAASAANVVADRIAALNTPRSAKPAAPTTTLGAAIAPGQGQQSTTAAVGPVPVASAQAAAISPPVASVSLPLNPPSAPPTASPTASPAESLVAAQHTAAAQEPAPASPALPHSILSASPTSLEVGVASGTHGWLKIRAELSGSGEVSASLSGPSSSTAAASRLRSELPGLSSFLAAEKVSIASLAVQAAAPGVLASAPAPRLAAEAVSPFAGGGGALNSSTSGEGGRAPQQQPGSPATNASGGGSFELAAPTIFPAVTYGRDGGPGSTALLSGDYRSAGGWLNVQA